MLMHKKKLKRNKTNTYFLMNEWFNKFIKKNKKKQIETNTQMTNKINNKPANT